MTSHNRFCSVLAALLCSVLMAGAPQTMAYAAPTAVPLDTEHWVLDRDAEIVSFGGRTALIGNGYVKGVTLANGTLEADLWTTGEIAFAGFMFRGQSFEELEWIWFRNHKTNGFIADGVQYAPAYHGVSCWQLNPEANAPALVPKNEWVHITLKIHGNAATLYVKDKAVMTVDRLGLEHKTGLVGLMTFRKAGSYFSNFSYTIEAATDMPAPEPMAANVVTGWQLSSSFPVATLDLLPMQYPTRELAATATWTTPDIDPAGLVNITKYLGTPYQGRRVADGHPEWAILRTTIGAAKPKHVRMIFGYSDAVTLFLNGVPLYSSNNAFLSRNKADGEWIAMNDSVFLALKPGRNELVAVVGDDFGGWGFQAKLEDMDGVRFGR